MWKEFKEFAMTGNLIDIAVGFVLGAAFGKLTSAFVDGMVVPLFSLLTGGVKFDELKKVIVEGVPEAKDAVGNITQAAVAEVAIQYGAFLTATLDFLIVALVMFLIVKAINKMKKAAAEGSPPPPPADIVLLEQIRDLLKK